MTDKLLKDYILGRCTADGLRAVSAWAGADAANARRLFRMEEAWHAGRFRFPDEADTLRAELRLMRAIHGEGGAAADASAPNAAQEARRPLAARRALLRYAAAIAAIVAVAAGAWFYLSAVPMQEIAAAGSVRHVRLDDGTEVWLNAGSLLRCPERFAGAGERRVQVAGEAMLRVKKDAARPFVVEAGAVRTRVLGTVFNVNTRARGGREEVCLVEGRVQVSAGRSQMVLTPNQMMSYDPRTGEMTVRQVNAPLEVVWHDNIIPFEAMTVREIADILERFYGVQISIDDRVSRRATYSGEIHRSKNIDSVLTDLGFAMSLRHTRSGRTVRWQPQAGARH